MVKNERAKNDDLVYGIDDKPSIGIQVLLGFQNIFAAFGGIIAIPLVISSALGFDGATILGSFVEVISSYFIKPLLKFFPPIVALVLNKILKEEKENTDKVEENIDEEIRA